MNAPCSNSDCPSEDSSQGTSHRPSLTRDLPSSYRAGAELDEATCFDEACDLSRVEGGLRSSHRANRAGRCSILTWPYSSDCRALDGASLDCIAIGVAPTASDPGRVSSATA